MDPMDTPNDAELAAAAEEELKHALTLTWAALAKLVPWGDAYEGFGPSGGALTFERSYIWRGSPGGDILCEVTAYREPQAYEAGARASRVIRKPR
jgi:hypothetical protein